MHRSINYFGIYHTLTTAASPLYDLSMLDLSGKNGRSEGGTRKDLSLFVQRSGECAFRAMRRRSSSRWRCKFSSTCCTCAGPCRMRCCIESAVVTTPAAVSHGITSGHTLRFKPALQTMQRRKGQGNIPCRIVVNCLLACPTTSSLAFLQKACQRC